MRFDFDEEKSRTVKSTHGVSIEEAQEMFAQIYVLDQKRDDPEQFRAIGWCGGRLCSVIFEIRQDVDGDAVPVVLSVPAATSNTVTIAIE